MPSPNDRPPGGPAQTEGDRLFTVFGGTGFVGRRVVRLLLHRGHRVRIAARHPRRRSELLRSDRAEPVEADVFEPETLSAALRGADGAVNAVSLYVERGDLTFHAVHVEGARRVARLAGQTGVGRLVHISGIGSDPGANDRYICARGEGEIAVRDAFPAATLVRPAVMFGPDGGILRSIAGVAGRSPAFPLFGRGETRLQPVHVCDVARAIVRLLEVDDPDPCYELAGPDVFTYRDLVLAAGTAAGARTRTVGVPFAAWKGLARFAERLPGAPLTRNQVALMERDNVASGNLPGMDALGIVPRGIEMSSASSD